MTILVTGGAGFIGANFVLDWLAASDEPVVNLDKLTYAGNPETLASLQGDARHQLVQGDIGDSARVNRLLAGLEVDPARMLANIDRTRGFALSQRVAFALAEHMSREEAEALVREVIADAVADDVRFEEALGADPRVTRHLAAEVIAALLDPQRIEAPAVEQVRRTLEQAADPGAKP